MRGMDMSNMNMPGAEQWGPTAVLLLFVMWAVMMVAMMVPSAAPMVLAFLRVNRRRQAAGRPFVSVGVFLAGYLAIWTAY
jgi:predicted metal-binding membrane protein